MNYRLAGLFGDVDGILGEHQLLQMVEFPTWSRVVEGNLRSSIIDHVYVKVYVAFVKIKSLNTKEGKLFQSQG